MRPSAILCKLSTDSEGWPMIQFSPDNDALRAVAAFLQQDVDILLPACDELLQAMASVLQATAEEQAWNGNRFLLRIRSDRSSMTDKYGEGGLYSRPVTIDTALLNVIVAGWREFVSALPRQRELALVGASGLKPVGGGAPQDPPVPRADLQAALRHAMGEELHLVPPSPGSCQFAFRNPRIQAVAKQPTRRRFDHLVKLLAPGDN
jgi:hypothetical protein